MKETIQTPPTLGARLLKLRKTSALTLQQLSEQTNISRSNLYKYEKNMIKPTSDAIIALARFFQVTTDWLLLGTTAQMQKAGTPLDPDLQNMTDILRELMTCNKEHLRSWTIIQFQTAFQAQYETLKKEQASLEKFI